MTMDRQEHLDWCKKRALEYLNRGDVSNAIASMMSDLNKHPETESSNTSLGMLGIMYASNNDVDGARRWITGFN